MPCNFLINLLTCSPRITPILWWTCVKRSWTTTHFSTNDFFFFFWKRWSWLLVIVLNIVLNVTSHLELHNAIYYSYYGYHFLLQVQMLMFCNVQTTNLTSIDYAIGHKPEYIHIPLTLYSNRGIHVEIWRVQANVWPLRRCQESMPNSVTYLNQPICLSGEWLGVESKNVHQNDTCQKTKSYYKSIILQH